MLRLLIDGAAPVEHGGERSQYRADRIRVGVRHDLIMNREPVPDPAPVVIVGKIFLPLVTG
jgi:hypothetical protein